MRQRVATVMMFTVAVSLGTNGLLEAAEDPPGATGEPADVTTPETAAVLAVDTDESIPEALRVELADGLGAGLGAVGFAVVPSVTVRELLGSAGAGAGCRGGPCLAKVSERLGARYLLLADVRKEGEDYIARLRLTDGPTGDDVASAEVRCELCAFARLRERLTITASSLRARMMAASEAAAVVARHKAEMERKAADEVARLEAEEARWRPPYAAIGVGGVGVVGVVAGVWLLALQGKGACLPGDPKYPRNPDGLIEYPDPSRPDFYRCRYEYATLAVGLPLLGVGIAAMAGAAVWIVVSRSRARRESPSAAVIPIPGGLAGTVRVRW